MIQPELVMDREDYRRIAAENRRLQEDLERARERDVDAVLKHKDGKITVEKR